MCIGEIAISPVISAGLAAVRNKVPGKEEGRGAGFRGGRVAGRHRNLAGSGKFRNAGWKCLGRISPYWPIVPGVGRLMWTAALQPRGGFPVCARRSCAPCRHLYIIPACPFGITSARCGPLHVRERDRTIKRPTRMELSSESRMRLTGERCRPPPLTTARHVLFHRCPPFSLFPAATLLPPPFSPSRTYSSLSFDL